jgi:head-tail adaptor
MQAGRLSDLLVFQAKTRTTLNEIVTITWSGAFQEWGEAERLNEQACRFTIRYRSGITPDSHRILFFGAYWTITSVVQDRRHTALLIDCDFSDLIEVTHMQSEVREYIDGLPVLRPRVEE